MPVAGLLIGTVPSVVPTVRILVITGQEKIRLVVVPAVVVIGTRPMQRKVPKTQMAKVPVAVGLGRVQNVVMGRIITGPGS